MNSSTTLFLRRSKRVDEELWQELLALDQDINQRLERILESAPFTYAARSRQSASVNFSASVRASLQVLSA